MLAPSGSTKLATVRGILSPSSAAASMVGSVASDDVVENAIAREGQLTPKNRAGRSRAISTTAGTNTAPQNTASPAITATTNTAIVFTSDQPNWATAPTTSAKMPIGASSRTQWTMRINAPVATSARSVSVRRCSFGRPAAATAQMVVNTIDRKSTRLNSSHSQISYAVFC